MRFILLLLLCFTFSQNAFAVTQAKYLGFMGLITITDRVLGQVQDQDPQALFAKMKVPEKTQPQGRGKNIQTAGKMLNIVCMIRVAGEGNCSIVVRAGANATISPGLIRFQESGAAAAELFLKLESNGNEFHYETADRNFVIDASPEKFLLEYKN